MDFSKDWRDYAVWFVLAVISVFGVPFLVPYIDNTLVGNPYGVVVKVVLFGIIFSLVGNLLYNKLKKKGI